MKNYGLLPLLLFVGLQAQAGSLDSKDQTNTNLRRQFAEFVNAERSGNWQAFRSLIISTRKEDGEEVPLPPIYENRVISEYKSGLKIQSQVIRTIDLYPRIANQAIGAVLAVRTKYHHPLLDKMISKDETIFAEADNAGGWKFIGSGCDKPEAFIAYLMRKN